MIKTPGSKIPKTVRDAQKEAGRKMVERAASSAENAGSVYDLIIIGGGPAGLAAAVKAKECGLEKILITERSTELGGILNQCIHNGFGLTYFKEELTGPEYASRFIDMLEGSGIEVRTDTMVLDITADKEVHMVSPELGYRAEKAHAVILAMGCRERSRGALSIPGTRPAGVYTAGAAQKYVNIDGYLPGRRIVILGSGDIGLIMARRLTLEGAKVLACVELNEYSSGLNRNIVQCLNDYNIPLLLGHTVTNISGDRRVEQVTVQKVDENKRPIPGTEIYYDCDTLLLSVGLIPENELSRDVGINLDPRTKGPYVFENMETSMPGVFACGNVLHVHDLVDFVTQEAQRAAQSAAEYVKSIKAAGTDHNETEPQHIIEVQTAGGITYTVPQHIRTSAADPDRKLRIFFRVGRIFGKSEVAAHIGDKEIARFKKPFMMPGEMQNVEISLSEIAAAAEGCTLPLTIEAKEAE